MGIWSENKSQDPKPGAGGAGGPSGGAEGSCNPCGGGAAVAGVERAHVQAGAPVLHLLLRVDAGALLFVL
eukprot:scaffold26492_cov90-Isochrysis_galbana.AAC.1